MRLDTYHRFEGGCAATDKKKSLVQEQWIDISIFDNGFAARTFIGAGPQAPWKSEFTWTWLLGGATHFWRVNALLGGTWLASRGYSFTTGYC